MARQNLSGATQLFFGPVSYAGAYEGKRGVPMDPLKTLVSAPAAVSSAGLISASTGAENPNNTTTTYTFPGSASPVDGALATGVLDVPRNIEVAVTHASSVVAMTIVVTGKDQYGRTMVESLSIAATGTSQTASGKKAFKSITSIALTSAGNSTSNTVNIGTGKKFGLPVKVTESMLLAARFNGAIDAGTVVAADATDPATATTGDVRGTFAPAGTPDGAKVMALLMQISNPATAVGTYGVAQYAG